MSGDASTPADSPLLANRQELARFFRALKWFIMPRMAFWAVLALDLVLVALPEFLPGMRYPVSFRWRVKEHLAQAASFTGLAAALAAAIEGFCLKGYRGRFADAERGQFARAARFWLGWTLVCAVALIALLYCVIASALGPPDEAYAVLLLVVGTASAVGFALWHRRLTQLCEDVAEAFGAVSLAGSARHLGLAWRIATAASPFVGIIALCAAEGRSETIGRLAVALLFFLFALLACALFVLQGILQSAADLLTRSEGG